MAESDAIVNVLNLLSNNFVTLKETIEGSSERQETLLGELNSSLKSLLEKQNIILKTEETKSQNNKRDTGIDKNKDYGILKTIVNSLDKKGNFAKFESIIDNFIGAIKTNLSTLKDEKTNSDKGLNSVVNYTKEKSKSKVESVEPTGIRKNKGLLGGLGKGLGKILSVLGKTIKIGLKFLGPLGILAAQLLKAFDLLQGTIGFLISITIAGLGIAINAVILYLKELPGKLKSFFTEDLPILFSAAIEKLKDLFFSVYDYLQINIFEPLREYLFNLWEGIKIYVSEKVEEFIQSLTDSWSKITEFFDNFKITINNTWISIINFITSVILNIKDKAVGMFTSIIDSIIDRIKNVFIKLKRGLGEIPLIGEYFKGEESVERENKKEETVTKKPEKELNPYDFTGGIINQNVPQNVNVELDDKFMKEYNESLMRNQKQTEQLNQSVNLLVTAIDKKDLGTTVINNTAPAPTQSYSRGGTTRR